ncbi:CoA transferase subunit A [Alkalihalobacillus sp. 1P02AB]|uniref:CoA transferase subunit A n=1 Tax=Alkalihalobacillus sp. 1P02AB TaxID=3132260 RepID=UPI0039A4FF47
MEDKVQTLEEAIHLHVKDGQSVVLGACLEPMIPFAAAYEIIRQQKKELTLIAPISDILFDLLIGTESVSGIKTAWAGNVSAGLGHNYRRCVEEQIPSKIDIEDHSNFSLGLSLLGGAMGVPYLPTKSLLGTDLLQSNRSLSVHEYEGEKLVHVPALNPDVAILGVQRADKKGNAHFWGNMGVAQDAALASKKVILLAEEIVKNELIISDPNRVLVPGFKVTSVVHCPAYCHPSPMPGHYSRDHLFFHDYHKETKTRQGFLQWVEKWVMSVTSHEEYLDLLGHERVSQLKVKTEAFAASVNYAAE